MVWSSSWNLWINISFCAWISVLGWRFSGMNIWEWELQSIRSRWFVYSLVCWQSCNSLSSSRCRWTCWPVSSPCWAEARSSRAAGSPCSQSRGQLNNSYNINQRTLLLQYCGCQSISVSSFFLHCFPTYQDWLPWVQACTPAKIRGHRPHSLSTPDQSDRQLSSNALIIKQYKLHS